METRLLFRRAARQFPLRRQNAPRGTLLTSSRAALLQARHKSDSSFDQAHPIGDYYASILSQPLPTISPKNASETTTIPATPTPKTDKEETIKKAKLVFGSRLPEPEERRAEIDRKSKMVAGVMVPPKPTEPDNCCMSGCVNCVWDVYRDELEEWAAKSKEAAVAQAAGSKQDTGVRLEGSMDDDGGGSETNWGTGLKTDFTSDDLFENVPIGIREFMKQEKKLKEKHAREGTSRG
jgi:hypothetical protein